MRHIFKHLPNPNKDLLATRIKSHFHDPVRAYRLVTSKARQEFFVLLPPEAQHVTPRSVPAQHSSDESQALGLVVYNVSPGRPSYAVFIADGAGLSALNQLQDSGAIHLGSQKSSDRGNELHLFRLLVEGILALPEPGRLSFSAIPCWAVPTLREVVLGAGYALSYDEPCIRYACAKLDASAVAATAAAFCQHERSKSKLSNYRLCSTLSQRDLDDVDRTWAYHSEFSRPMLSALAEHNLVCSIKYEPHGTNHAAAAHAEDELAAVAWAVQYYDGSTGVAYTMPEHRRLGLMRHIIIDLTSRILASGQELAFSYIVKENEASLGMFRGLQTPGFAESGTWHWLGFVPADKK